MPRQHLKAQLNQSQDLSCTAEGGIKMTLEQALAKITELETEITKLKSQISNQNSYITKLEKGEIAGKGLAAQPTQTGGLDPATKRYLEKTMIKDTIAEARQNIVSQVGEEVYKAVEPDFKAWLDKNLKITNCTTEFVEDAFNLVYGRCLRNKEHAVHKALGKDTPPVVTPNPTQVTPNPQVLNTPPVITPRDGALPTNLPPVNSQPKSKKDIFAEFSNKIRGGGNPFQ